MPSRAAGRTTRTIVLPAAGRPGRTRPPGSSRDETEHLVGDPRDDGHDDDGEGDGTGEAAEAARGHHDQSVGEEADGDGGDTGEHVDEEADGRRAPPSGVLADVDAGQHRDRRADERPQADHDQRADHGRRDPAAGEARRLRRVGDEREIERRQPLQEHVRQDQDERHGRHEGGEPEQGPHDPVRRPPAAHVPARDGAPGGPGGRAHQASTLRDVDP